MNVSNYHPVVNILIDQLNVSDEAFAPYHEQLLENRMDLMALKEVLLRYKVVKEPIYQEAIARFYELEYRNRFADLNGMESFTGLIPIRYAKKFMFFPIKRDGYDLEVAVEDPANLQPIDNVAVKLKCRIIPIVSNRQAITDLINQAYERTGTTEQAIDDLDTQGFENILEEEAEELLDSIDEEPVKRLVNSLLWQAAREDASDVHIDPSPRETNVRYRIDGVLYDVSTIPKNAHLTVVNRVKVMSRLDIAQKGMPQDGRTRVLVAGKRVDIRVSTVPTVHGEKVVMRLLYQSEQLMNLDDLGLVGSVRQDFNKIVHKTGGIILVTGPTGSGKTTTLYAALGTLDRHAKNVITIEDPVEYKIPGYSQIEVNHKLGLTFANALRSVLRQDPDIIMVGEMRDTETAQIAIQAALTGHLVFSTVHTNNAPATITRLIDMQVEPFLVTSTIIGVLAQRLVRRICAYCKESYVPHHEQLREVGISEKELESAGGKLHHGKGCGHCRDTGYHGRIAIHELLLMNDQIKQVVLETNDENAIKQEALENGMITLRMDGASKILRGMTTIEEILSVTREG
ncbi:MAG: Flp pilus assembly complex ATPase component TadA [SAR324 cluster bacterium]|nr:Flp pilus assembly complex ATPase component TadA [SAR324 cluster bacterium]